MGQILANKRFFPNYPKIMITYPFGGSHYGIDLVAVPQDEKSTKIDKIMAHDGGTVSYVGYDQYAGYIVEITIDKVYVERYQHLAKDSITVKVGQTVKKGQIIATMGNTGSASQGAHLHFAIRENGKYINPQPYLDKDVKAATPTPAAPTSNNLKAGTKYELKNIASYQSPDAKTSSGPRSGTYYIWSEQVDMGRVRMTNSPARVGVPGQVSFFVNMVDLTGGTTVTATTTKKVTTTTTTTKKVVTTTTKAKPIVAGAQFLLNNVPVYNNENGASVGKRTGTYYVWSNAISASGRVRMTNRADRVGKAGQVSFFVDTKNLK